VMVRISLTESTCIIYAMIDYHGIPDLRALSNDLEPMRSSQTEDWKRPGLASYWILPSFNGSNAIVDKFNAGSQPIEAGINWPRNAIQANEIIAEVLNYLLLLFNRRDLNWIGIAGGFARIEVYKYHATWINLVMLWNILSRW
jgi:hypothetical protein